MVINLNGNQKQKTYQVKRKNTNKIYQTFSQTVIKYLQISINLFKYQVSTFRTISVNLSFKLEGKVKAFSDKEKSFTNHRPLLKSHRIMYTLYFRKNEIKARKKHGR